MYFNILKKFIYTFSCLLLLIIVGWPVYIADASANDNERVVKIAYIPPEISDLEFLPITQIYKSYLDEISKFADWRYEMVPVAASDAMSKLKDGSIDLILPIEYDEDMLQKDIVYSRDDIFYDILAFYASEQDLRFPKNNSNIFYENNAELNQFNGLRIGSQKSRNTIFNIDDFLKLHGINATVIYYDNIKDMENALASRQIDLFIDTITRSEAGLNQICAFSAIPARFAALSINKPLIDKLDTAIMLAKIEDFDTMHSLQAEFVSQSHHLTTHFTPAEREYINNIPALNVVIYGIQYPFVARDEFKGFIGIYPDILREISNIADIKFNFVYAENYEQAVVMLDMGLGDIILDAYNNDFTSPDFFFTNPILSEKFAMIGMRDNNAAVNVERNTLIVPHPLPSLIHYVKNNMPGWNIVGVEDNSTAFEMVNEDPSAIALIENIALQSDRSLLLYPRLTNIPTASMTVPLGLAISKHKDVMLRSILNKAIIKLDNQVIEQITLRHTVKQSPAFSFRHLLVYYPLQLGMGILVLITILLATCFMYYTYRMKYKQNLELALTNAKLNETNEHLKNTIEKLKEANMARDSYRYMAEIDGLTGVYNKAGMESLCRDEFIDMDTNHSPCAFFIIDLDHFKQLNDTCGHQKGDDVLKQFAASLKKIVRHDDYVGRFGGDEFVLLLRNINSTDCVKRIASQIKEAALSIDKGNAPHQISASIGIAFAPVHANTYEDVFSCADKAVYHVKENGRNDFFIYSDDLLNEA